MTESPPHRTYRRLPALRVGALIRLQDGSLAKVTALDPATDRLEIGPASRFVVAVRRMLGNWDRRGPVLGGEMIKGYVSSSEKDVAGFDPLLEPNLHPVSRQEFRQAYRHPWWSRLLCRLNLHDWRDGPGQPCAVCGLHDWIFCPCEACTRRRGGR